MDLVQRIKALKIPVFTDDDFEALYQEEHKHLSQGWLLDWHDAHAVTIERIVLVVLSGSVVLLLMQLFPTIVFSDIANGLLAACLVLSVACIASMIYRYTRLPTKTDKSNSGSSLSGGFMNNDSWRENILFPHEVYKRARLIKTKYPDLHIELCSQSLYLLHPGLPIVTERDRVIHQVLVRDPGSEEAVSIGIWVHVRENRAA